MSPWGPPAPVPPELGVLGKLPALQERGAASGEAASGNGALK